MSNMERMVNNFIKQINKYGGNPSEWYTGIASDPEDRLKEHNAKNTRWIYDNANTERVARSIEKHMIENVKTKGGGGGGNENTTWVYCYKITTTTDESA